MAKLRLVCRINKAGEPVSYFHVERSEAHRMRRILTLMPKLKEWTPLQKVAARINSGRIVTENSVFKLMSAKQVTIDRHGRVEVIATAPLIDIRKEEFNPRSNPSKTRYLRPRISLRSPHC